MLKTHTSEGVVLVTQPDHALVSGRLASLWGNEVFARPGHTAPREVRERLRAEVVHAVREHDNGWWEWEADPRLDPRDGLPYHLIDLTKSDPRAGVEHWRLGVGRLAADHPYGALLVALHAYWLYAEPSQASGDGGFLHPLFGDGGESLRVTSGASPVVRDYVHENRALQGELRARVEAGELAAGLDPDALELHGRLLQVLDAMSLALSSHVVPPRRGEAGDLGSYPIRLPGVPRAAGDDRVDLDLLPDGPGRVVCDPWPFRVARVEVEFLARRIPHLPVPEGEFHGWWHEVPWTPLRYTLTPA